MKNIKKISLILTIIVVVALVITTALVFLTRSMFSLESETYDINQTENINSVNITLIDVNVVSSDINILESNSEDIEIALVGKVRSFAKELKSDINNTPKLIVVEENGELTITIEDHDGKFVFFDINRLDETLLEIKIPKNKIDIDINTVSGDLEINNFTFANFTFEGVSSDANINNIKFDNFNFNTVSGDLEASTIETGDLFVETTSGDINFGVLNSANAVLESVSGDISLSYEILSNNIDIDTVSGDVDIKTPQNSSFSINFDSVSGDLDNSFTGISKNSMFVINEGLHQILVNTVSGDLRIFN